MRRAWRDLGRAVLVALVAPLALLALAVSASGSTTPAGVVVGGVPSLSAATTSLGSLPPRTPLKLTVVLAPRDAPALAAFATAVSTPGSPSFHHYLSVSEFAARFGARPAGVANLRKTLRGEGLAPGALAPSGLSIAVRASAAQASRAFGVSLRRYRQRAGREVYANTAAPRLPAALGGVVVDVIGLDNLPSAVPEGLLASPGQGTARAATASNAPAHAASDPVANGGGPVPCSAASDLEAARPGEHTIDQIAAAYGMTGLYAAGDFGAGVTVALYELEPYPTQATDIGAYEECFGITGASVTDVEVDRGPSMPTSAETAVDIENVLGLAPAASIEVYQGPNSSSGIYDTLATIVNQHNAQVINDSWALCEPNDQGLIISESYLFEEAAAQGQSVVASSGDRGANGCTGLDTVVPDPRIAVDDAASQPYVTGVGGTSLLAPGPPAVETSWSQIYYGASGGGISSTWAMPGYQLYSGVPGIFNSYTSGKPCAQQYCREVPDVSADGSPVTGYVTYYSGDIGKGPWRGFGGTSTSAPVWAALAALADASGISGCTPSTPLGFLNPLLYEVAAGDAHGAAFNDITVPDGHAPFSALWPELYPDTPGYLLYPVTPGYDMSSGLGTPIATDGSSPGLVAQLCAAKQAGISNVQPTVSALGLTETAPGSAIIVDGSGFTPYTQVWFGANKAPGVTLISSSELSAIVPPGSGTVDVTVTEVVQTDGISGRSVIAEPADVFTYAPTATITSPASGATYTQGQPVTASYSCASSAAGPLSCTASQPNGATIDTSTLGSHQFSLAALDANGFSTTTTASYSVIAPPAITISRPASGGVYAQGQAVAAQFSCATSAPATIAACSAPGGVDTTTTGAHSLTVAATDSNGVTSTLTASYTVVAALPNISVLHQTAARWTERGSRGLRLPIGTTFSFSLDQPARVILSFARSATGRVAAGRCVSPSHARRKARRCTRSLSAGTLTFAAQTGANALGFSGSTSTGQLPAGSYTVILRATGLGGQLSAAESLRFTIVAAKS